MRIFILEEVRLMGGKKYSLRLKSWSQVLGAKHRRAVRHLLDESLFTFLERIRALRGFGASILGFTIWQYLPTTTECIFKLKASVT
jgi:hypothetical protein